MEEKLVVVLEDSNGIRHEAMLLTRYQYEGRDFLILAEQAQQGIGVVAMEQIYNEVTGEPDMCGIDAETAERVLTSAQLLIEEKLSKMLGKEVKRRPLEEMTPEEYEMATDRYVPAFLREETVKRRQDVIDFVDDDGTILKSNLLSFFQVEGRNYAILATEIKDAVTEENIGLFSAGVDFDTKNGTVSYRPLPIGEAMNLSKAVNEIIDELFGIPGEENHDFAGNALLS